MEVMADEIDGGKSFETVVKEFITKHRRIIFNGDGYSAKWEEKAKELGLLNNKNTVDALNCLKDQKNVDMFKRLGVYSDIELKARHEILLESYIKTIQLEGLTALKMAKTQLYPAVCDYLAKLSSEIVSIKNADLDAEFLFKDANKLTKQVKLMKEEMDKLEQNIKFAQNLDDNIEKQAIVWRDYVFTSMQSLREITDMIEESVDAKYWPIPTYVDLLFGI